MMSGLYQPNILNGQTPLLRWIPVRLGRLGHVFRAIPLAKPLHAFPAMGLTTVASTMPATMKAAPTRS